MSILYYLPPDVVAGSYFPERGVFFAIKYSLQYTKMCCVFKGNIIQTLIQGIEGMYEYNLSGLSQKKYTELGPHFGHHLRLYFTSFAHT